MLFIVGLLVLRAIVFASHTDLEDYPYRVVVNITHPENYDEVCGGTLISPEYVLAPAYCAIRTSLLKLTLGSIEHPESQIQVNVTENIIHPDYDPRKKINNIALLKLPQPVKLSKHLKTVKLAQGGETFNGKDGVIVTADYYTGKIKTFPTKVLSVKDCQKVKNISQFVVASHICVEEIDDVQSCMYAGSPLIIDGIQVGFSSFGAAGCPKESPSVFTRVSSYADWINEKIGKV